MIRKCTAPKEGHEPGSFAEKTCPVHGLITSKNKKLIPNFNISNPIKEQKKRENITKYIIEDEIKLGLNWRFLNTNDSIFNTKLIGEYYDSLPQKAQEGINDIYYKIEIDKNPDLIELKNKYHADEDFIKEMLENQHKESNDINYGLLEANESLSDYQKELINFIDKIDYISESKMKYSSVLYTIEETLELDDSTTLLDNHLLDLADKNYEFWNDTDLYEITPSTAKALKEIKNNNYNINCYQGEINKSILQSSGAEIIGDTIISNIPNHNTKMCLIKINKNDKEVIIPFIDNQYSPNQESYASDKRIVNAITQLTKTYNAIYKENEFSKKSLQTKQGFITDDNKIVLQQVIDFYNVTGIRLGDENPDKYNMQIRDNPLSAVK